MVFQKSLIVSKILFSHNLQWSSSRPVNRVKMYKIYTPFVLCLVPEMNLRGSYKCCVTVTRTKSFWVLSLSERIHGERFQDNKSSSQPDRGLVSFKNKTQTNESYYPSHQPVVTTVYVINTDDWETLGFSHEPFRISLDLFEWFWDLLVPSDRFLKVTTLPYVQSYTR